MSRLPIFLGFRAKVPWTPEPKWFPAAASHVERACSVSDCLVKPPEGWIDRWDFNRAGCYATEAEALAAVPTEQRKDFTLFAYWLMPLTRVEEGREQPVEVDDAFTSRGGPLPTPVEHVEGYHSIGFDVVATEGPDSFGFQCSPLSCNGMAETVAVNRYCLVEHLEDALAAAQRFNTEQPEPGDYVVVKVAMREAARQRAAEPS